MSEWFFKNDAPPCARRLGGEPLPAQVLNDESEETWRGREIKQMISTSAVRRLNLFECVLQPFIGLCVLKFTRHVIDSLLQPVPQLGIHRTCRKLTNIATKLLAKLLRGHRGP